MSFCISGGVYSIDILVADSLRTFCIYAFIRRVLQIYDNCCFCGRCDFCCGRLHEYRTRDDCSRQIRLCGCNFGLMEAADAAEYGEPGANDREIAILTRSMMEILSELASYIDVAVKYREHWFWIDDLDIKSKKVFSFLMFLFTLAETGMPEQAPVLTIPTR